MQGEVIINYDGIGGANMNSGISTLSLGGSTNGTDVNEDTPLSFYVSWSLPGGIANQGIGGSGGAWGYIFGREEQEGVPYTDALFCAKLMEKYGYSFDSDCNLTDESQKESVESTINQLVSGYFYRVMKNSGLDEEYNWNKMNSQYNSCMVWM